MSISFENALGIHHQALAIRSQRAEILSSNIANADTPGYKARDIDFKSVLNATSNANNQTNLSLKQTNSRHFQVNASANNAEMLYRVPNQSSLDGNTVDEQVEKSAFAENAIRYQASLTFLGGKFKSMLSALKGE